MMLTYAEAARSLGVSVRTIKSWVKLRLVPVVRITRKTVRIRQHDLDRMVDKHRRYHVSIP